jgi:hypothetical protein
MTRPRPIDATLRKVLLAIIFTSIGAGALFGVAAILSEGFDDEDLAAAAILLPIIGVIYGCMGLINFHAWCRRRYVVLTVMTMVTVTLAAMLWVLLTLTGSSMSSRDVEDMVRWAGSFTIPGVAMTLAIRYLLMESRVTALRVLIHLMAVNLVVLGLCSLTLIWAEWLWYDVGPLVGFGLIVWIALSLFGLMVIPTLIRLTDQKKPKRRESLPTRLSIELSCPGCGAEQVLSTGVTACRACRFALVIEIEEPRCECGYLLYRLEGDACPECGKPVPESARWVTAVDVPTAGD